jgi:chaperonin GroES
MKLKPLGDRVIVKALEDEVVTASGLVLPDTAKEKPQRGTVLAVGDGRWDEGVRVPLSVAEGDVVIYSKYGGTEIKMDGDDVLILSEHDILAKVTGVPAPKAAPAKPAPVAAPAAKKPAAKKPAAKK